MLHNEPTKTNKSRQFWSDRHFIYTHPQFGANEDSWKLWQQLRNWASNLWKHRSQLIFAKTAKTVFKSAQLLLVHSIFFGVYWFFWALFMLWLWKTPLKKSSLWGFNLPPHYWGTTLCHLHPFQITHHLNLKSHTQDPGVHIDWSS